MGREARDLPFPAILGRSNLNKKYVNIPDVNAKN
jgi:hypothetical protein